jgi:chromosome partitioning protein
MKIIVPTNNKGGVGKTKVSVLIAEFFARFQDKRVLAIDFDPQCNFSHHFLNMEIDSAYPDGMMPPLHPDYKTEDFIRDEWDGRSSIADIFYGNGVIPYPTHFPNLDIAPGFASKLLTAEAVRKNEVAEKIHKQLSLFINSVDVREAYDLVVVDTAPSKGPLTISAIKAATHIIIPSLMEELPIQGVYGMLQLWAQESFARPSNHPLELIGILPNMYQQINLHKGMLESLKRDESISKYVIPHELGDRVAFAEVDATGAIPNSVFDLPDRNLAKQEALKVCHYIAERIE